MVLRPFSEAPWRLDVCFPFPFPFFFCGIDGSLFFHRADDVLWLCDLSSALDLRFLSAVARSVLLPGFLLKDILLLFPPFPPSQDEAPG